MSRTGHPLLDSTDQCISNSVTTSAHHRIHYPRMHIESHRHRAARQEQDNGASARDSHEQLGRFYDVHKAALHQAATRPLRIHTAALRDPPRVPEGHQNQQNQLLNQRLDVDRRGILLLSFDRGSLVTVLDVMRLTSTRLQADFQAERLRLLPQ